MPEKRTTGRSTRTSRGPKHVGLGATLIADARQLLQPPAFRIADDLGAAGGTPQPQVAAQPAEPQPTNVMPVQLVCEIANCLWYIKTRHFRRKWTDEDDADADPATRRSLGRLNRGISALSRHGIQVIDKTGERYPPGGEGFMKPIEFLPTAGVAFDVVSEMVRPIVMIGQQTVQSGEAFVAVPIAPQADPPQADPTGGAPT